MDELFENWAETKEALLEGLSPDKAKIVDPLLDNQKDYLLSEAAAGGSTAAHDVAGFRKILIPMIRRIIPGTIATELVGVQPMQGPVGLVYTLRYKYGEDAAGILAGQEAFGNDPIIEAFYSGGDLNDQAPGASGIGPGSPGNIDDAIGAPVIDDGTGTPFTVGLTYRIVSLGDSDFTAMGADNNLVGEVFVATAVESDPGVARTGTLSEITATGDAWGSTLDMFDTTKFGHTVSGGSGSHLEGSGGRKMNMEMLSQPVQAGSRKLQAGWTIEAMQDLNAQHGLDLENEMTQVMSAEIVQEIDAEIISDLLALAGTVQSFDYDNVGQTTGGPLTPAYIGDRFANLAVVINYVCNEIGRKTRRGVGNFIVVSPMIVSVLQSAAKSVFAPSTEGSFKGPNNTMLVGTLNSTIKVYSYLWNQIQPGANSVDQILLGYKGGNGETDSGYFYCPYIPLMSSGVVVNPLTFQPVVSLMTRYGKTTFTDTQTSLGNSADYYGKIIVSNMKFV